MEVEIRRGEIEDHEDLYHIHCQPKAIEGTLQLPFPSKAMWKNRISQSPEENTFLVAVVDGQVVGSIELQVHRRSPRRMHAANIGMTVRDDLHGKGIGTKLLEAILDLCDNWMNLRRIELEVFTDNHEAIKLYKKNGFIKEGTHKDYAFKNGRYCDVFSMARIVARS